MSSKPLGSGDYYDVVFYAASKRGRMKPLVLTEEQYSAYRAQAEKLIEEKPKGDKEIDLSLKGVKGGKAFQKDAEDLAYKVSEAARETMGQHAPSKSEIHIIIRQRPTDRVVETLIEGERLLEEQLTKAEAELKELPQTEQNEVNQKLQAFKSEVKVLRESLQQAHKHFVKGEVHKGMQGYATVMNKHFPAYVKALQEWTVCQKTAAHFNVSTIRIVDESRPQALLRDFEELRARAEESGGFPPDDYVRDWNDVNKKMSAHIVDHQKWIKRNADTKSLFAAKLTEENKYLASITKTHELLCSEPLKDHPVGYDLDSHKKKLEALKLATEKYVELLEKVNEDLAQGRTEKAINSYTSSVTSLYSAVLRASTELIIPQDQLEGRIGAETELSIDLYRQPRGGRISKGALESVALETLRKVLAEEDLEVLKPLETALKTYQEAINTTQFTHTLRETLTSEKTLHENLHRFNQIYNSDRETLLDRYRAIGIPDAQISYLFSDLNHVESVVENMVDSLQKIVDAVNGQNHPQAMDLYLELMETQYPLYTAAFQHSVDAQKVLSLFVGRGIDIAEIFSAFCVSKGKKFDKGSQFPLNLLFQRPLRHELFAKDIFKLAASEHKIEKSERWDTVQQGILEANQSLNAYSDSIDHFIASDGLPKQLLLNPDLKGNWKALLKKAGWTQRDVERLSNVYDAYGGVMSALFQMRQGYEVETDPGRKRALKAQMRLHVETKLEQINTINGEYHRLMTPKRRAALERAFADYASQKKDLMTQMTLRYEKQTQKHGPPKEQDFLLAYEKEIGRDQDLKSYRSIEQLPVQTMLTAFDERTQWMNNQMEFLHYSSSNKQIDIAGRLLSIKDPIWRKELKKVGWTSSKILRLQTFYDNYLRISEPLLVAKARFDEDPENPTLLAELRKVVAKVAPKINKLEQVHEQLGGMEALATLKEAIASYSGENKDVLPLVSLDGPYNFVGHLQEVVRVVIDAAEIADTLQPIDPEYGSAISEALPRILIPQVAPKADLRTVDLKTKLEGNIADHLASIKEPVWLKALERAGWTPTKIQRAQNFYEAWMRVSKPLLLAKVRFDKDPKNSVLLAELQKVAEELNPEIEKLDEELEALGGLEAIVTLEKMTNTISELQKPKVPPLHITKQLREVVKDVLDGMESAAAVSEVAVDIPLKPSWVLKMTSQYSYITEQTNKIVALHRAYEANPLNSTLKSRLEKELKSYRKKFDEWAILLPKKRSEERFVHPNVERLWQACETKRKFLSGLYPPNPNQTQAA